MPRSSGRSASSPSSGTPTSTRTRRRRSASRRSTRRTRCCPTRTAASATTCSAGRESVAGPRETSGTGFGGFSDIFDAFFGGATATSARRGRPQTGSDLRYDLRITFAEAITGTEKEIEFRVLDTCETCNGSGAKPGTSPTTCPQCNGRGEVRTVRQTMLGQMVNVVGVPALSGRGAHRREPMRDVPAARAASSASAPSASRSRPASTRATRSGCPARARSGRAAARRGACTWRSTSARIRR